VKQKSSEAAPRTGITPERISETLSLIRSYVRQTPTIEIRGSELGVGDCTLYLKLEYQQHSGSFKARGAFANLLSREPPRAGVVAASGGNHGAAVAYAAGVLGVPATIFVPTVSSPAKMQRIRGYGAELRVVGDSYSDALEESIAFAEERSALQIHAFDQRETILGQGTLGAELERQVGAVDMLLVSVGGGGLLAGQVAWFDGRAQVVGVEPVDAPTLTYALRAGAAVDAPVGSIAVDSLAPRRIGSLVFDVVRDHVVAILVSDDDIRAAQQHLWERLRVVVEPGGAAAFAAVLTGKAVIPSGGRVAVVLSGANTNAVTL
jgi:threonine dehydratase